MRFLGIDYGTKRIGVAISDERAMFAFPKEIVLNNINTFKRLGEILKEENISEIVVGESVDFSGKLNALSARIEIFIKELEDKFSAKGGPASGGKLSIHKQKEFLTSVEARRFKNEKKKLSPSQAHNKVKQKKSGHIDASAAALILQRYLDKKNSDIKKNIV